MAAVATRKIGPAELAPGLFAGFERHQHITRCWRQRGGTWVLAAADYTRDWSAESVALLVDYMRQTLAGGGTLFGAYDGGRLCGFAALEGAFQGSAGQYLELSALHISAETRNTGVGTRLFCLAADLARSRGAKKLYISTTPTLEAQHFYKKLGCVDALEPSPEKVAREPLDRQMEYAL